MNSNEIDRANRCLRLLLLPVMRFCLRRSLKFQEIVEACKGALVDAARDEIDALGGRATTNRISIMTGIHRADIARLEGGVDNESKVRAPSNLVSRVLSRWQVDERFMTVSGKPRVLTFDGKQGEFAKLVDAVSSDPNPYSVLQEMERIGAVEITPRGVHLKTKEYIISADAESTFAHLAQDSEDLIVAVEENIAGDADEPNLHLRTEYDNIGASSLPVIRRWLLQEGSSSHRRIRQFLAKYDRDTNKKRRDSSPRVRVSLCSFSRTHFVRDSELAPGEDRSDDE